MAKPLHSEDPNPKDPAFSNFGVLDAGKQSKSSVATSTTVMVVIAALFLLSSYLTPALNAPPSNDLTALAPPPPPPPIALVANRRAIPTTTPLPIAAAVNGAHRNPMVGQTTGPDTTSMTTKRLPANNLPIDPHATSIVTRKVDPGSVGNGPDIGATKVSSRTRATTYGDGPPTSALVVSKRGVAGATGTGTDPTVPIGAKRTFAATAAPPPPGSLAQAARPTYIPDPNSYYTAAAKAAKVAGTIVVRIRILASGAVQPIGIEGAGLGYGLNEAAMAVARGTRCKPALDASGHPIDSENVINVRFQNAGVN